VYVQGFGRTAELFLLSCTVKMLGDIRLHCKGGDSNPNEFAEFVENIRKTH